MAKQLIRLTEGDLHRIVENAVDKVLQQQEMRRKWDEEDRQLYTEFEQFLVRNGIRGAKLHKYQGNSYCISISTDEYRNSDAARIADRFAKIKNMYVNTDDYPATTYLWLNKL